MAPAINHIVLAGAWIQNLQRNKTGWLWYFRSAPGVIKLNAVTVYQA